MAFEPGPGPGPGPAAVTDQELIAAVVQAVLPAAAAVGYRGTYRTWDAPAGATAVLVQTSVLRPAPERGVAWSPGFGPQDDLLRIAPTLLLLGTADALVWTTSRLERIGPVVAEEHLTAHTVDFDQILGAQVKKRGRVEVWLDGGGTLALTVPAEDADGLAEYVNRLA